jgi:hypothetical protein
MSDEPDRVILAFTPSDADHATDGHLWSLYNQALNNPYSVPDADEKLNRAQEKINPHGFDLRDWERWIRVDYNSVLEGDPERLEVPKPDWYTDD